MEPIINSGGLYFSCVHTQTVIHPSSVTRCIYTLYLMSDSYLGLDQQYDIHLNVTPASIAAQVNTEVSDSAANLTLS